MPTDIDYVVGWSKKLEARLRGELKASGDGLGQLAESVRETLPPETYRQLRKVAKIRNEIVHDARRNKLENKPEFTQLCESIDKSLNQLKKPGRAQVQSLSWGCMMLLCMCCLLAYLFSQHPS